MSAYVFPGQGSQHVGMGKEVFNEFPELVKKADDILGYSIENLCLKDPKEHLNNTAFTQPALFVVNALTYYKTIRDTKCKPNYVAGHSLGEYNALLAAEVFDFETGLRLVQKRGQLMSQVQGGGMAAVVGLGPEQIRDTINNYGFYNIDIANYNSNEQTVISGYKHDIDAITQYFTKQGAKVYLLKVSAAFHSRYMQSVKEAFGEHLHQFKLSEPSMPIIANYTGRPYIKGELYKNMTEQLCSSVRWVDTVKYLLSIGEMEILEIGPKRVLTKLVNEIKATYLESTLTQNAFEQVANWNNKYTIGTKVRCKDYHSECKTRTKAVVLFGHCPAIYLEGYSGYFDLNDLQVIS